MIGQTEGFKNLLLIFSIGVVFFVLFTITGHITIQVTGQPQIDNLGNQLTQCQGKLNIFMETESLVCKCNCPSPAPLLDLWFSFMAGLFVMGMIILVIKGWDKNGKKKPDKKV